MPGHDFSRCRVIVIQVSPSLVSDKGAPRAEAMRDDNTRSTALYKKAYNPIAGGVAE